MADGWLTYGKPYEQEGVWLVDVHDSMINETNVKSFDTEKEALRYIKKASVDGLTAKNSASDPVHNLVTGKYEVMVFPPGDNLYYEIQEFNDEPSAKAYLEKCNTLNGEQRDTIRVNMEAKESFADKMMKYTADEDMDQIIDAKKGGNDALDEEQRAIYHQRLKETRLEFKRKKKTYEVKARNVLLECAKFYMGEKHDIAYTKYKVDLNKMTLASLMFQMDTAEEVIYTMASEIKTGNVWARNVEVMAQMQRVVLDIGKFQAEYLSNIEKDMLNMRDHILATDGDTEPSKDGGNLIFIKGGKRLVEDINGFIGELTEYTKTAKPTKNKLLRKEMGMVGDGIEDTDYEELNDVDKGMGESSGLETYGDD